MRKLKYNHLKLVHVKTKSAPIPAPPVAHLSHGLGWEKKWQYFPEKLMLEMAPFILASGCVPLTTLPYFLKIAVTHNYFYLGSATSHAVLTVQGHTTYS